MKNYIAFVEVDSEVSAYGVVFPDFPGLTTVGDSYEDAVRLAHEALAFHVNGLLEDGEQLPKPRTIGEIKEKWEEWANWKDSDYVITSIALLPPFGTQKILVSMDSELIAKVDAIAKNRSAFFASAVEYFLSNTDHLPSPVNPVVF